MWVALKKNDVVKKIMKKFDLKHQRRLDVSQNFVQEIRNSSQKLSGQK